MIKTKFDNATRRLKRIAKVKQDGKYHPLMEIFKPTEKAKPNIQEYLNSVFLTPDTLMNVDTPYDIYNLKISELSPIYQAKIGALGECIFASVRGIKILYVPKFGIYINVEAMESEEEIKKAIEINGFESTINSMIRQWRKGDTYTSKGNYINYNNVPNEIRRIKEEVTAKAREELLLKRKTNDLELAKKGIFNKAVELFNPHDNKERYIIQTIFIKHDIFSILWFSLLNPIEKNIRKQKLKKEDRRFVSTKEITGNNDLGWVNFFVYRRSPHIYIEKFNAYANLGIQYELSEWVQGDLDSKLIDGLKNVRTHLIESDLGEEIKKALNPETPREKRRREKREEEKRAMEKMYMELGL